MRCQSVLVVPECFESLLITAFQLPCITLVKSYGIEVKKHLQDLRTMYRVHNVVQIAILQRQPDPFRRQERGVSLLHNALRGLS